MDEPRQFRVDAAGVRALGHPLRLRIMEALLAGPSTATLLGRELGESSGATSYHLRILARFGFVEEVEGKSRGRERWWRRPATTRWVVGGHAVDARAAGLSTFGVILERDEQALAGFVTLEEELDPEWRDAATIAGWKVTATPPEVSELADGLRDLVEGIRARPERPGARAVYVTFRVLPQQD